MKPYPVQFKYISSFELLPGWLPEVLQTWLEEEWTCDIKIRRVKHTVTGRRMLVVDIIASTSEDLAAKRRAFNSMIEAKGYGPNVLRKYPKIKKITRE